MKALFVLPIAMILSGCMGLPKHTGPLPPEPTRPNFEKAVKTEFLPGYSYRLTFADGTVVVCDYRNGDENTTYDCSGGYKPGTRATDLAHQEWERIPEVAYTLNRKACIADMLRPSIGPQYVARTTVTGRGSHTVATTRIVDTRFDVHAGCIAAWRYQREMKKAR